METIFIVNPTAGQGKTKNLIEQIQSSGSKMYITNSVGDAENYVRAHCETSEPVRFIACGGDGTFNEVLNGACGKENAEIGIIPIGTGNDFCRNFKGNFYDVSAQLKSPTIKCDAIRYTNNGKSRFCANMFNIGFDCNVADMTANMKKKPFISGSLAYLFSIFVTLIKKNGANAKIEIDGNAVYDGALLLTSVANGKYCGGGIMSNPFAKVSDGKMNVNIICNISRLRLLTLLPRYMKGTHPKIKNIDKIIKTISCEKLVLKPNTDIFRLCCDGEIQNASDTIFEIIPKAFNFVLPCI